MIIRNFITRTIIFLFVVSGLAKASDNIFTFAPKASETFLEHVYTVHARLADNQQGLVDSTKSFYHSQYFESPIGFDLERIPDSIITLRNGELIQSPISEAMAKTTSRLVLDEAGHCMTIEGYDKLISNLVVEDSALYKEIVNNLNPNAMVTKEVGDWNFLFDPLAGLPATKGIMGNFKASIRAGAFKSVVMYTQVECVDTFRVDGVLCARVYYHSDSDFERLAKRRDVTLDELKNEFSYEEVPAKDEQVDALRVVQLTLEVKTMKIMGMMLKSQMTIKTADQKGAFHTISLVETKDMRYFYEPAK